MIHILIKHGSWNLFVCPRFPKSQGHDILALGLIWANLKHDQAQFLNLGSGFWAFLVPSKMQKNAFQNFDF